PTAIVGHDEREHPAGHADTYGYLRRAGMFDDVVDGFLQRQEEMAANVSTQRHRAQIVRNLETAAQTGGGRLLLHELRRVLGEALHAVVSRIHRPHQFVHRLQRVACGVRYGARRARRIGDERDMRETRPEVVVQIARDARTLTVERLRALEFGDARAG